MAEAPVPQSEIQQVTPPSRTEGNRATTFKDLLQTAAESGRGSQAEARGKWRERFSSAKESGRQAWRAIKDSASGIDAAVRGLANNPDLRRDAKDIVHNRIDQGREAGRRKMAEITTAAIAKKDAAVDGFKDRMVDAGNAVNEHVVIPLVDRATTIGKGVAEAATRGSLFVFDAGVSGVDAAKGLTERGAARAKRWGTSLGSFMRRQGERVGEGFQSGKDATIGAYYDAKAGVASVGRDVLAAGAEVGGRIQEKAGERAARKAENLAARARSRQEAASSLRARSVELRTA